MGLGTVLSVEHRTVTIHFLATGETRTYAKQSAPLTRVSFAPGDSIRAHEGWDLNVQSVSEQCGLLTYHGTRKDGSPGELSEAQLDNFLQLNRPSDRLFAGQVDADKWFELRYQTLLHASRIARDPLRGLLGARTSLIPHQLYIAHEVANRYAPRVLLADEVGLGKTIEAGLILHQQLLSERAQRVLIVVPESLVHQWLVEMLRRFNLHFSLFDEERCLAIEQSAALENPFLAEQYILCSLGFVTQNPARFEQLLDCPWDLLVVDEAHHLQWSEQHVSTDYHCIEQLAAKTAGVLLLTATPEQLGKASHFARLRLLDPDRFPDYARFLEEEKAYEPVANAVQGLLDQCAMDTHTEQQLRALLAQDTVQNALETLTDSQANSEDKEAVRQELIEQLLDRHGTGRVLFRNTRAALSGFPERVMHAYPLPLPSIYADNQRALQSSGVPDTQWLLCPERLHQHRIQGESNDWVEHDPRIPWLIQQLKQLGDQKVLLITANAETAMDICDTLRRKSGLHAALFHEQLSLLERDRAAAYFSDMEYGSPVLICSEIGSEGRNFQFAHHLILFDLPLNPDLLEQRIGRLDRIGQDQTIHLHVPYLQNSAQAVMFTWYHEGLQAFEHTNPAAQHVFSRLQSLLLEALHQIDEGIEDLQTLILETQKLNQQLNDMLHRGRDRLLEYNSCRPHVAQDLHQRAHAQDADPELPDYLENVFDCFGIDSEIDTVESYIVRPGSHRHHASFPGLDEEGMTITYRRERALANESWQFMSWEHPLVSGAIDLILSAETGNTAVTAMSYAGAPSASMLLECLFVLESASSPALQSARYLPPTCLRVVIDQQGKDHHSQLTHEHINQDRERVMSDTAAKIVRAYAQDIKNMIKNAELRAQALAPEFLKRAHQHTQHSLMTEIERLTALRQVNPNVREEEIHFFENQLSALSQALNAASLRVDAMRLIIVT